MKYLNFLLFLLLFSNTHAQEVFEFEIIGESSVDNTVDVIVRAKHDNPIKSISLIKDNDIQNQVKVECDGNTECELTTSISLDYEGSVRLRSFLWEYPNQAVKQISTSINFTCDKEYCKKDPVLVDFVKWMRQKGYDEAVTSEYFQFMKDDIKRSAMKDFLDNSLVVRLKQEEELNFYDVIPSDTNATYTEMSTNGAENCVPTSYWTDFCPTPIKADYSFVEEHFERIFGVNFTFNYIRRSTNYTNEIGPLSQNTSGTWEFNFIDLNSFESQFERKDIVHYGLESLDGKPLNQTSSGPSVSRIWRNVVNWYDITTYTHEYGHTSGLPHSFISGTNPLELFSLDGIMNSGYAGHTSMFDPLDPMERYSLEPINGYLDDATFAEEYNEGIKETSFFDGTFKNVEPLIESFVIKDETDSNLILETIISNTGELDCSFFDYSVIINGNETFTNRIIENIAPDSPNSFFITIPKNIINGSSNIRLEIDPDNLIVDEEEENNISELVITSSINQELKSIFMYPNPNSGVLHFNSNERLQVRIFDLLGNQLMEKETSSSVSFANISNGIYIVKIIEISSGDLISEQKIVLIKN